MARRSRTLRVLKWVATSGCCLVGALFLFSGVYAIGFVHSAFECAIDDGQLFAGYGKGGYGHAVGAPAPPRFIFQPHYRSLSFGWPELELWRWYGSPTQPAAWGVRIPLWLPLTGFLAASLIFWFLDRQRPLPGHCRRCRYDLTGNLSGICPECGAATASAAS